MLTLTHKEGSSVEVKHHSGDVITIHVSQIEPARPFLTGQPARAANVRLVYEDDARNFTLERSDRRKREHKR